MIPHRILLADDDCLMTHVLGLKLEDAGFVVDVVRDGAEGLEHARRDPPNVVITDLQMPGMDGYSFAKALRENAATAGVPIVMLTGRGHILTNDEIAGVQISHVIPKPFSANQILQIVLSLLDAEAAA